MRHRITRREFLQQSALAGAAAAWSSLAGCAPSGRTGLATAASPTVDGVDAAALRTFAVAIRGRVILPDAEDYDRARRVWNALFDKRPAMIVRCADTSDVVRTVEFARRHQLPAAVRSGGHSAAGYSVCDGGVVIDLSAMKRAAVDPDRSLVDAGPGLRRNELLRALQPYQLATPMGACPDVGIAGLTLGGGQGDLIAKYGLSCDALAQAEVVTADGRVLTASAEEHPELFWGLRGGAGNFGIVTAFRYRVYTLDQVVAGVRAYPVAQARDVLRFYRDAVAGSPDELSSAVGSVTMPDGAVVIIAACYCGEEGNAERALRRLRSFGTPIADTFRAMSYLDDNAPMPSDMLSHTTGGFFPALSDAAIEAFASHLGGALPSYYEALFTHFHGAVVRVPAPATAFPLRSPGCDFFVTAGGRDPAGLAAATEWLPGFWSALQPHTAGVYVNVLEDVGEARVRAAYGANYPRLVALKNQYDPTNFFRLNQNVEPTM